MTTNRTFRVGVDLDGVCYNFVNALRVYLISKGWDPKRLPEACCWEFPVNHWGLTWPQFNDLMNEATDAGHLFAVGDPFPNAIESLHRIADAGHELHVITDRHSGSQDRGWPRAHDNTRTWLEMVGFPKHSLRFDADKLVGNCDFFVEDRDKNYYALVAAGVNTFLVDRPYNRHVETAQRISDLSEYADAVLNCA